MGNKRIVLLLFGWMMLFSVIAINMGDVKVAEASWKATADNDQLVSIEFNISSYEGDTLYLEYAVTNNDAVVIRLESSDVSYTVYDADTGKKIGSGRTQNWGRKGVEILPNYWYRNKVYLKADYLGAAEHITLDLQIHGFIIKRLGIPLPAGY